MNARNWLILAGIAGVLGARPAVAGNIPLPKGQFASTQSGSFAICLDPNTFDEQSCSTTGVLVVPLTALLTGAITYDKHGNSCASFVETDSVLPVGAIPPLLTKEHVTYTVTSYDSSNGTGDASFNGYTGGSCNGASFDSTGATKKLASGTIHFVVSEQGKRVDFELTSLTNPNNAIPSFSQSGVNHA